MNPLHVFLHARLSGPKIHPVHAAEILVELTDAMRTSGLLGQAKLHLGVSDIDFGLAEKIVPNCDVILFESGRRGELPTLIGMQKFLATHEDCYVLYFHTKCASRTDDLCEQWRKCMTHHLIRNWQTCAASLDAGFDSVGCHWMTPEQYPGAVGSPYWGGNFWWSKSQFLKTLPMLPEQSPDWYLPEAWIGLGPFRPKIRDFHHAWPNVACGELRPAEHCA
jgi:hypothetical protein